MRDRCVIVLQHAAESLGAGDAMTSDMAVKPVWGRGPVSCLTRNHAHQGPRYIQTPI